MKQQHSPPSSLRTLIASVSGAYRSNPRQVVFAVGAATSVIAFAVAYWAMRHPAPAPVAPQANTTASSGSTNADSGGGGGGGGAGGGMAWEAPAAPVTDSSSTAAPAPTSQDLPTKVTKSHRRASSGGQPYPLPDEATSAGHRPTQAPQNFADGVEPASTVAFADPGLSTTTPDGQISPPGRVEPGVGGDGGAAPRGVGPTFSALGAGGGALLAAAPAPSPSPSPAAPSPAPAAPTPPAPAPGPFVTASTGPEQKPLGTAPVSPVPEPETYAMMAAGLALLGWRTRLKALRDTRTVAAD
jgi:hypothetical protein